MVFKTIGIGALAPRLILLLALLGGPSAGFAAGTWSVIPLAPPPDAVHFPAAVATDSAGNLYVAEVAKNRIRKRDAQGNWSVLATEGRAPGQVFNPTGLAVDGAGNLYVAEEFSSPMLPPNLPRTSPSDGGARIQKRDAQGNWSVLATEGPALGQVFNPAALAADAGGNLYVASRSFGLQKRDSQGNWSWIASGGTGPNQVGFLSAVAVDTAGNLYVAEVTRMGPARIRKRDLQGKWSDIATYGAAPSQVLHPTALAVDSAGNLYVADIAGPGPDAPGRIQKRDPQGNWTLVASPGSSPGQIAGDPAGLAADAAGNLYVADRNLTDGGRIQKRDAQGNWSIPADYAAAPGQLLAPTSVAVDSAGALYVAGEGPLQKRDAQGNWSLLAELRGSAVALATTGDLYVAGASQLQMEDTRASWSVALLPGEVAALAVDMASNVYVALSAPGLGGLLKRDAQGTLTVLAAGGQADGQVYVATALAVDAADNLYVADSLNGRVQKRDAQGYWTVLPAEGADPGQGRYTTGLAADAEGSLYVADYYFPSQGAAYGRVRKRDTQGNWSLLGAGEGTAPGQFHGRPGGLAVDGAGNLYVADTGNHRVLKYTPGP
jgi:tripartite motif-containing protein 71